LRQLSETSGRHPHGAHDPVTRLDPSVPGREVTERSDQPCFGVSTVPKLAPTASPVKECPKSGHRCRSKVAGGWNSLAIRAQGSVVTWDESREHTVTHFVTGPVG